MGADPDFIGGHDILAVERYMDATRHMIIFDVLARDSPQGEPGDRLRRFLTDEDYRDAQVSEERGEIKISTHAAIIEGHILVDRKKKRRRK